MSPTTCNQPDTEHAQGIDAVDVHRIIDQSPVANALLTAEGQFLHVNHEFSRLFGQNILQLGTLDTWWQRVHTNDTGPSLIEEWRALIDAADPQGRLPPLEIDILNSAGEPLTVRLHGVQLADGRILSVFIDLTREHRTEAALLAAQRASEAANQAKSAFLANMSHELRTPLNAILGYAQVLSRDSSLPPRQHDAIDTIRSSGKHLLSLINDILDLSRIEAGQLELEPTPTALQPLFTELLELFSPRARSKGIDFRYQPVGVLPQAVMVDARRLREIVINLISNAIKFTEHGEVRFESHYDHGQLTLEVCDTGIGIDPERLESIFHPFNQQGNAVYRQQGTGLGLSISRHLAQQMGGRLEVHSTPGQGSCFTAVLSLPSVATSTVEEIPKRVTGYQRRDGFSRPFELLVVDDIDTNRELLLELLSPLGFDIRQAIDGNSAIEAVVEQRPDLVLMDLVMPNTDGLLATQRILDLPACDTLPVVACSARAYPEDLAASRSAGCRAHLIKPIQESELLDTLATLLPLDWLHHPPAGRAHESLQHAPELQAFDPAQLDEALRDALYHAVLSGSQQRVRQVMVQLNAHHPELVQPIGHCMRDFAYQRILDWLAQTEGPT